MKGGEQLASFLEEQSVLVRELLLLLICDVALFFPASFMTASGASGTPRGERDH
jgi:hypothetical protein